MDTGFQISADILALMPGGGGKIPTVAQIAAGMPPFVAQGASPGCYAALVAAIIAALPAGASFPTKSESSGAQTVTSGAGAGTKGNWQQMIAAIANPGLGMSISISRAGAGYGLFDIGFGASGSEAAQFVNIGFGLAANAASVITILCSIPTGTRISMRISDNTGGTVWTCVYSQFE